ncbi:MAG TPA: 50S ribosomal protein L4 [bacterium]|uniref:Large ribosomal subunit protein uL4 n=1 Tax=candidate division TA06 bacterium ADurb.Bin417 TaxID=1852828 RepID=A0A1V5MHM2_UNCT6|nr:MAG: 50S ribosomal protein L4 [candidate division TA06 bacterium ADurb.Bin417]HNQ35332.1 50S ribosomal protein L4 [bacterium]HNS49297.1 50S ribosomal protein L4 [bacterium]
MEIKVYNLAGEVVGREEFDTSGLAPVNQKLLYYAVNAYRANQRQGTASTKTRGEVSGGGHKPWRQKGTGRARVGSNRSPLWRKGGITFGPRPRDYRVELPAKMRRRAQAEAIKAKIMAGSVGLLENLQLAEPKTKLVGAFLKKSGICGKILLFAPRDAADFRRAGRNIPGMKFADLRTADFYSILNADYLIAPHSDWGALQERLKA